MPRITKRLVEVLPPNKSIWDSDLKGFGARRKEGTSISYILKYRHLHRQRIYTIGKHGSPWTTDQARREAKRLIGEVAAGVDPAASRKLKQAGETLADIYLILMEKYLQKTLKPTTVKAYDCCFRLYILPELGGMKITDVTYRHINKIVNRLHDRKAMANEVVKNFSRLFSWAEEQGYTPEDFQNPCRLVKRYKITRKRRYMSEDEVNRVIDFIDKGEDEGYLLSWAAKAIKLLLFTGARKSEITTLQWSMVKLGERHLHLPESKTGEKIIHLNEPAIEVFRSMTKGKPGDFVFPGTIEGTPITSIFYRWREIRKKLGLDDVRLHDLRHTFASIGVNNGMSLPQIGKLLGHSNPNTTAQYAHVNVKSVRHGAETIGSIMTSNRK